MPASPFSLFPNYGYPDHPAFPFAVSHAEGSWLYSENGDKYLDLFAGIAVNNLGHRHPAVQAAVADQLQKVWHTSNYFLSPTVIQLAQTLTKASGHCTRAFLCNSGVEANEAAFKLARKFTGKKKILAFHNSFHGRSHTTLSATGQPRIRQGFFPLGEEYYIHGHINDNSALELIDESLAAIVIEPIQGDGGLYPAEPDFLRALALMCRESGVLLIVDEIQTGMGRTGQLFAYQNFGVEPDIISLAKGLGNGLPIGAILAREELAETFNYGSHGTTFGGNLLAVRAAAAVLEVIQQPGFLAEVQEKGLWLLNELKTKLAGNPKVKELRGLGLMQGVALHEPVAPYLERLCREHNVACIGAGPDVLRLVPALTISRAELEMAVQAIVAVLS
ncbi:acetylornithine/succinylornithine family transaminase [Candidatus Haliotispira prima]|uniref:Acetylornithine/succinylornithine family transaminase n=1 Tax=Candidatus Haliotispira prima TaxID=3034016 RepID=A0ABY8ME20_9SPIO|nr:acetylornithine/succinylornithine family transaminase [Candidatus Haliotispira prima]